MPLLGIASQIEAPVSAKVYQIHPRLLIILFALTLPYSQNLVQGWLGAMIRKCTNQFCRFSLSVAV